MCKNYVRNQIINNIHDNFKKTIDLLKYKSEILI
jgi:hypothetical protein